MQKKILYHVTLDLLARSVEEHGILTSSARTVKRVWLCNRQLVKWALRHVAESHQWSESDLVVYRVTVPVSWLTKRRYGVYYCKADINPLMIESVAVSDAVHPHHMGGKHG